MCYRVVERYSVCKCVYFTHGIDQCNSYGMIGHAVIDRDVLVGHSCAAHAYSSAASSSSSGVTPAPAASVYSAASSAAYSSAGGGAGIAAQHRAYLAATHTSPQQMFRGAPDYRYDGGWGR